MRGIHVQLALVQCDERYFIDHHRDRRERAMDVADVHLIEGGAGDSVNDVGHRACRIQNEGDAVAARSASRMRAASRRTRKNKTNAFIERNSLDAPPMCGACS